MSLHTEAAILSAITGIVVTDLDEVLAVYDAMAGGSLMTHQIPSVYDKMKTAMDQTFSDLAAIDVKNVTPETVRAWMVAHPDLYSNKREVKVLGDFAPRSPMDGLDPKRTIVVKAP